MDAASNAFRDSLLAGQSAVAAGRQAWVNRLRAEALERANALAVPTVRDEDWRFTDLSPLYRVAFRAADTYVPQAAQLAPWIVPEAGARLVFVDGRFAPSLSALPTADTPLFAAPLATGIERHGPVVEARLGQIAGFQQDLFVALNTAYLQDGAMLVAAAHQKVAEPVHVLFVSTQKDVAVHPRVLVIAESGAELTLVEDYVTLHDGAYCVNAVTEITVAPNALVHHVKLQRDSKAAYHVATGTVRLERDGRYRSNSIALGARISRQNLNVVQAGPNTECHLDGLALIAGRQLADTHSFIDHALPHGTSRQLHKCVAGGGAHAVFNGRVLVRPDAQQTDSAQQNRNLLLSDKAHVDTKPQLEIFADDVKCAHGATVGQLEAEEVFYLRSRGLDDTAARNLLTYAFAADIVNRIPLPSLAAQLRATVLEQTGAKELA
ncbi:MAG: Fe-S cluster assembly protein SufD [Burkholderiales bacterium]|nr:Fe-S cluster assembly protein SufD [Burkholderiales bacterium]